MKQQLSSTFVIVILIQLLTACSLSIDSFSNNLNKAVLSNNDPQTVIQALPAYLVLMDGLIESDPEDVELLITSARLMNAYASLLGSELELMEADTENIVSKYQSQIKTIQQKKLTEKALQRSVLAICLYEEELCDVRKLRFKEFESKIQLITKDNISLLYSLGTAWAAWLQINSDDWNAMAQLPQIQLIMQTVNSYDESWDHAGAHMYLGVLNSLLPTTLGGKPEQGKFHFEKVIELTGGKNLMAKVLFAEYYARLVFDEKLHKQLITDVLSENVSQHDLILLNTLARQKAKVLQASADDYF